MRTLYLLSLILTISAVSQAFVPIEECNPKFEDFIQMRDFKPMIIQYRCSAIFAEVDCPLENPLQTQAIVNELNRMLIDDVPFLVVENPLAQIPLDSSYYTSKDSAATLTCVYYEANEFPKCIRGTDLNNVVSTLMQDIFNKSAGLLKNKEFNPKGHPLVELSSIFESTWIKEVIAKFSDKAIITVKEDTKPSANITTVAGYLFRIEETNQLVVVSWIEANLLHEEIFSVNVIDLKLGQTLESVVPKDKPFVLYLYYNKPDSFTSLIELFNLMSQAYDPDQITFVRAFIPAHMPLVFKYAVDTYWRYHDSESMILFPQGLNPQINGCDQQLRRRHFKSLSPYVLPNEYDFVHGLEQYGFKKPKALEYSWKEARDYASTEDLEKAQNILRIYLRTRYGLLLPLQQRAALREVKNHFNETLIDGSTPIEFVYEPSNLLRNDEEDIIKQRQVPYENTMLVIARYNGKIINHYVTNTKINSKDLIQFVNDSIEALPTWLDDLIDQARDGYEFVRQIAARVWYKLFPDRSSGL